MFARVLFPTDFSAYANAVFACLPELKAAGMRELSCAEVMILVRHTAVETQPQRESLLCLWSAV